MLSTGTGRGDPPRYSVCIRGYRRPHGLIRAIESALAQDVDDLEVVVSDDSGDLADVVEGVGDARVRYSRNPGPHGSIANLRRACDMARGDYVVVVDDDDRLLPGFLRTTAEPMDRDPSIGIVFTSFLREVGDRRRPYTFPVPAGLVRDPLGMVLAGHQPGRSATLIRRSALERGEREFPLLEGHHGDLTTWIRTAATGWRFWAIEEPLAINGVHRGQLSAGEGPERLIRTLERFRFDDAETDALRRARLGDARRRRALILARRGRIGAARHELSVAATIAPPPPMLGWAASVAAGTPAIHRFTVRHPRVGAVMRAVRSRFRPPVTP